MEKKWLVMLHQYLLIILGSNYFICKNKIILFVKIKLLSFSIMCYCNKNTSFKNDSNSSKNVYSKHGDSNVNDQPGNNIIGNPSIQTLESCSSVAVLYGTFTRIDGVIFTASMSASSIGNTPCEAQDNAQIVVTGIVLENFLMEYIPEIIDYTYYIEYTNKCGESIIGELCYNADDNFTVDLKLYDFIEGYTITKPSEATPAVDSRMYTASLTHRMPAIITSKHPSICVECGRGTVNANVVISATNPSKANALTTSHSEIPKYVDCTITNERTKQRIPSTIKLNLIQGIGGSNLSLDDYKYTTIQTNVTTIGSVLFNNLFSVKTVDGTVGTIVTNFIETNTDGARVYESIQVFRGVRTDGTGFLGSN